MAVQYTTEEGTLATPDCHTLYTKTWRPAASVPLRARLIFIHGFSDHVNFQGPLFPTLARHGIIAYAFDQRGWGRSVHAPAEKGKTGPTEQVMADITAFVQHVLAKGEKDRKDEKDLPLFLMGHSMGGQETLVYAATGPQEILRRIRGFLASAPYVALHPRAQPFKLTVLIGRVVSKFLPNIQMVQKLDPKTVCRDPAVPQEIEDDPLCHNTGTLAGMAGMLDRAAGLDSGALAVPEGAGEGGKTRLHVSMGSGDLICDFGAVKRMFEERLGGVRDKELKVYDGWYHKLQLEPGNDKGRFCEDVAAWVLERCDEGERAKL